MWFIIFKSDLVFKALGLKTTTYIPESRYIRTSKHINLLITKSAVTFVVYENVLKVFKLTRRKDWSILVHLVLLISSAASAPWFFLFLFDSPLLFCAILEVVNIRKNREFQYKERVLSCVLVVIGSNRVALCPSVALHLTWLYYEFMPVFLQCTSFLCIRACHSFLHHPLSCSLPILGSSVDNFFSLFYLWWF